MAVRLFGTCMNHFSAPIFGVYQWFVIQYVTPWPNTVKTNCFSHTRPHSQQVFRWYHQCSDPWDWKNGPKPVILEADRQAVQWNGALLLASVLYNQSALNPNTQLAPNKQLTQLSVVSLKKLNRADYLLHWIRLSNLDRLILDLLSIIIWYG